MSYKTTHIFYILYIIANVPTVCLDWKDAVLFTNCEEPKLSLPSCVRY